MLFMGWQNPKDTHWRGEIGRLIVAPDLSLRLADPQPFIGRDAIDPISLSYPWVIADGSAGFRMWYGSTVTWDAGNGEMLHIIKQASSSDGHHWTRENGQIPAPIGIAQAFSRPTVAPHPKGGVEMWFSYRSGTGEKYRIGHASARDGKTWTLSFEEARLDVSSEGWDSEMIEYPFVLDHEGGRYMLYNGNGYGKTGFGLAVLVDE